MFKAARNKIADKLTQFSVCEPPSDFPPFHGMFIEDDGNNYYYPAFSNTYMNAGLFPEYNTRWQRLKYHIGHGMMMQFPIWKILIWSLVDQLYSSDYIADAIDQDQLVDTSAPYMSLEYTSDEERHFVSKRMDDHFQNGSEK